MGRAEQSGVIDATPSASRLIGSLRDIGYDFTAAIADIVDNSVSAGARRVDIELKFAGRESFVLIADDGSGMSDGTLTEALRFGSRREYALGDLGRYGLGLKTASISQCRRLTVVTRRAQRQRRIHTRTLDLDHVDEVDRWELIATPLDSHAGRSLEWLNGGPGTVIVWEKLDRVLPEKSPEGGWARRRIDQLADRCRDYLGMVFHRFLEGSAQRELPLTITVNGEKCVPWNPFAPLEEHRVTMPDQSFEVELDDIYGRVELRRYVLPSKGRFSSVTEFEKLGGPGRWNRQQGLYIYRADRLIQHGGWAGIRAADEHTKLARASLDFQTDLDPLFQINVAKMRAMLPTQIRTLIQRPINELCHRADEVYRRDAHRSQNRQPRSDAPSPAANGDGQGLGSALIAAALDAGEYAALDRIMTRLRAIDPEVAIRLGW